MNIAINQLQAIPVTGNDDTFPLVIRADLTNGADHIVRFPSLAFIDGNIHRPQHIFHNRHLLGQFLGHTVTGSLIAIITQVTESRPVKVKGHTYRIGLFLFLHTIENIQKAENGIGIKPLLGSEGLDTKKCTIYDGVTVKNH